MIPSPTYFPTSFPERAAWFDNFAVNFAVIGPILGFTGTDVHLVEDDNDMMQFLLDAIAQIESYDEAARAFRRVITEGVADNTTPHFPTIAALAPPNNATQGIYERLDNLVKRIRLAPGFSEEEGSQLGINPQAKTNLSPDTAKPKITASVEPGNVVLIKFTKSGYSGIFLQIAVDKGDWQNEGRFIQSPATINIPQNASELPRSVAARARLLVGDNAVGDWSDIVTVQTMP